MKRRIYREYGNLLTAIGLTLFLTYIIIVSYWLRNPIAFSRPSYTNDPRTFVIHSFLPLSLILTCSGVVIRRKYREGILFLTRVDEPIHSGKPWYKGRESGLFLTSCGLVVSIDDESEATAHVGYRIIRAEHATHRDCVLNEGKAVLDKYAHGRAY